MNSRRRVETFSISMRASLPNKQKSFLDGKKQRKIGTKIQNASNLATGGG